MSVVTFFPADERLGRAMAAPGGKLISEAIADAQAGVADVAEAAKARVDEALGRIRAGGPSAETKTLYRDARDVAGLAAVCGLDELGSAALSLCTFLDKAPDRLTPARFAVFTDVMGALRHPEMFPPEGRAEILASLTVMVNRAA